MEEEQARPRVEPALRRAATRAGSTTAPASAPEKRWFVHVGGKNYGPYSRPDIERMATSGRVRPSDLLYPEGGSAWVEAQHEPAFAASFRNRGGAAAPPPSAPAASDSIVVRAGDRTAAPKTGRDAVSAVLRAPDQNRVVADLREFFGPRAEKYLAIYEKMRASDKPFIRTWNWVVFFTTFPWFFYRKMYVTGTLLILIPVLLAYLFGFKGNAGATIGAALSANYFYVQAAIKRMNKADALGLAGQEREDYLRRAGGVSVVAGALSGALFALMFVALLFSAYLAHRAAVR
jgi:GYF domain 2/Protein of unknown function (DUF2628)